VSNVLSEEKKQQVIALGRLGWSLRRIERAAHIRRETAGAYLRAAGIAVRPSGGWGRNAAKPAIEVSTDLRPKTAREPAATLGERLRAPPEFIELAWRRAQRDGDSGFGGRPVSRGATPA
jgi:hypothetical protein